MKADLEESPDSTLFMYDVQYSQGSAQQVAGLPEAVTSAKNPLTAVALFFIWRRFHALLDNFPSQDPNTGNGGGGFDCHMPYCPLQAIKCAHLYGIIPVESGNRIVLLESFDTDKLGIIK